MNSLYDTRSAYGLVTAPTAGQTLASITGIPPGYYKIDVTQYTSGTTSSADSDNVALIVPGDPNQVEPGAQGNTAISALVQSSYAELVAATNTISLAAIGAGGAAAAYHAKVDVTLWPRSANTRGQ